MINYLKYCAFYYLKKFKKIKENCRCGCFEILSRYLSSSSFMYLPITFARHFRRFRKTGHSPRSVTSYLSTAASKYTFVRDIHICIQRKSTFSDCTVKRNIVS